MLEHMIKHDSISTDELRTIYGYKHGPRVARDLREAGVPLITERVRSQDGRRIGRYGLGDPRSVERHKFAGRSVLPKKLLNALYLASGGRCYNCSEPYEKQYLQIDHRVPYGVAGEPASVSDQSAFMLLCGPCQRKKSRSCERCPNWKTREAGVCGGCYWAAPEDYSHMATEQVRRVELTFRGRSEVELADRLKRNAEQRKVTVADLIKQTLSG